MVKSSKLPVKQPAEDENEVTYKENSLDQCETDLQSSKMTLSILISAQISLKSNIIRLVEVKIALIK